MESGPLSTIAAPAEGIEDERVQASVQRRLFGGGDHALPSTKLGRFVLLEPLGSGGMGVVYAAYDPELDRKVALKLLRPERTSGSVGRSRMLREARSAAKLADPHVVPVFDVGTSEAQVWIAMEYVEGPTLRQWCEDSERAWEDVVAMYVQAGRGLAAAHEAGIVHRDFKPDNVLVGGGRGERARVTDFGLAHHGHGPPSTEPASEATEEMPTESVLTVTGTVMGTPAYMSPEQHLGERTDARSDQFSFCVALYEALWGKRPFSGPSRAALAVAVTSEPPLVPSDPGSVPKTIRNAIMRGLARDPRERWPDMAALLSALEPTRRQRSAWMLAGLGVAAVGAVGLGLTVFSDPALDPCAAGDGLSVQWARDRAAISTQLDSIDAPFAERTGLTLLAGLDAYVESWDGVRKDVCLDAHAEGSLAVSASVTDLRTACLDRRRAEFWALSNALEGADRDLLEHGQALVDDLPTPTTCATVDALNSPPAPEPDVAEEVEAIRQGLAAQRGLRKTGGDRRGELRALADRARATGYAPVLAEAQLEYGYNALGIEDNEDAVANLTEAFFTARGSGHETVAADAASRLVYAVGYRDSKVEEGRRWVRDASASLQLVGNPGLLVARLHQSRGALEYAGGDIAAAKDHWQQSHASHAQAIGEDAQPTIDALRSIGIAQARLGEFDAAAATYEEAAARLEKTVGRSHPTYARLLNSRAILAQRRDDWEQARTLNEEALELKLALWGESHISVASTLGNLASVMLELGEFDEGLAYGKRSLEIREASLGENHSETAKSLHVIANAHRNLGQLEEALAVQERSLKIQKEARGPEHPDTAGCIEGLAAIFFDMGRIDESRALYEEVLAIREKVFGPDHPGVVEPREGIGECLLQSPSTRQEGIAQLREVLELGERIGMDPWLKAHTKWVLGRALVDEPGRDVETAKRMLTESEAEFRSRGAQKDAKRVAEFARTNF